ncbi:MAG: DUF86 domain-containing protein [Maricaulaceae bacterium]
MKPEDRFRLEDMAAFARDAIEPLGNANASTLAGDRMRLYAVSRAVVAMRNRLIHGYRDLDPQILTSTVRRDAPALLKALEDLLGEPSS